MTTQQQFDQERAEAFAERMLGALNEGAIVPKRNPTPRDSDQAERRGLLPGGRL